MHRNYLLTQLKNYSPSNSVEALNLQKMINFIQTYPNCFDRHLEIGHITASAWIINPFTQKILLTHHKKLKKWLQLGGHADNHPHTLAVAIKESKEESGIDAIEPLHESIFDIDIHEIPENKKEKSHLHFDVRYLLQVTDPNANIQISDESLDLKWFTVEELRQFEIDQSVQRMINKWILHSTMKIETLK